MTGRLKLFIALILISLILFPLLLPKYPVIVLTELFILGIYAMSLDILMGYTGLVSFGHAAFIGVGGYVTGLLITKFSFPMMISILVGTLGSAVIALPIGAISVRSKGLYFAMLTMAFSQFLWALAYKWRDLTGGDDGMVGIVRQSLTGLVDFNSPTVFYYFILVSIFLLYLFCLWLIKSPFGKVLQGIRENEEKVESLGYNSSLYKIVAFIIAGAIAGYAGGLYSTFMGYVSPKVLFWLFSGHCVLMVIIGGRGTLVGPIIGAAVFVFLQDIVSTYTENWMLVVGAIFAVFVVLVPEGIMGFFRRR